MFSSQTRDQYLRLREDGLSQTTARTIVRIGRTTAWRWDHGKSPSKGLSVRSKSPNQWRKNPLDKDFRELLSKREEEIVQALEAEGYHFVLRLTGAIDTLMERGGIRYLIELKYGSDRVRYHQLRVLEEMSRSHEVRIAHLNGSLTIENLSPRKVKA